MPAKTRKKKLAANGAVSNFFPSNDHGNRQRCSESRLHGHHAMAVSPIWGSADDPLSTLPSANGLLQSGRR